MGIYIIFLFFYYFIYFVWKFHGSDNMNVKKKRVYICTWRYSLALLHLTSAPKHTTYRNSTNTHTHKIKDKSRIKICILTTKKLHPFHAVPKIYAVVAFYLRMCSGFFIKIPTKYWELWSLNCICCCCGMCSVNCGLHTNLICCSVSL